MDAATELARGYVALALRLRRLAPALVDAAAVPYELQRAVAGEPVPTAAALVAQAGRLAAALPDAGLDPRRARFLAAQLRALEWRARRLAGQHVPFAREVRACLDLAVTPGRPDAYRAAHRELDALLPGSAPLVARLAAHRRRDAVAPGRLGAAVRVLTAALRERVSAPYGLPADEGVEHEVVDDGPWRALHTYRGAHRSVVRVNAGARPGAGRLARLVAHETYPGHHVESCRADLAAAAGRVELAVAVLGTPQTVLSEGLAECALDVAVGPGWGRWSAAALAEAGVGTDGDLAERLDPVLAVLRRARLDAALLLHGDGGGTGRGTVDGVERAEAHLRRWLLVDDVRARRIVDALARPLSRAHVVAAVDGAVLVADRLRDRDADPVGEHLSLLDDPLTPDALRFRTGTERVITHDGR